MNSVYKNACYGKHCYMQCMGIDLCPAIMEMNYSSKICDVLLESQQRGITTCHLKQTHAEYKHTVCIKNTTWSIKCVEVKNDMNL